MDVRCERCKTEYEFEDDKITEAGVTVKCTSCGFVFKVKKRPAAAIAGLDGPSSNGSADVAKRDWRVRKANGDVFTFKELTTLQKWIVERKVAREDEISLTGESWKRLGNIAELSSFFQVVEAADRALAQPAPQTYVPVPGYAGGYPPPGVTYPTTPTMPAVSALPQSVVSGPVFTPQPVPVYVPQQGPQGPTGGLGMPSMAPGRAWTPSDDVPLEQVMRAAGLRRSWWKWLLAAFVGIGLGGGYYYYTRYWRPVHGPLIPALEATTEAPKPPEAKPAIPPPPPAPPVVEAKSAEPAPTPLAEPKAPEAKPPALKAAEAKAAEPVVAKPETEPKTDPAKPGEKPKAGAAKGADVGKADGEKSVPTGKGHDFYLAQGNLLRDRGKTAKAIEFYGKAIDLDSEDVEAITGLGLCFVDEERYPQAEAQFEKAIKIHDRYAPAYMGLAEAFRAQGQKAKAIENYQKYLEVLPSGPEADVARNNIERLKE